MRMIRNKELTPMGREISQIARRCERAVVTAYRDLRHVGDHNAARLECRERREQLGPDADAIGTTHGHEKRRRTHH